MPTLSVGRTSNGVTLIEMMVVLAIIGLFSSLSFPAASAGLDSVRLVSATDSVATFLNSAVNRVERRQQPIELEISLRENRLLLYSNEAGFTRELKMADGIVIEAVLPQFAEEDGGPRRFILMPG